MIKKFKTYIKEQLDHLDIDPYGEEDWDDDNLSPVLHLAKQQNLGKTYEQITVLHCASQHLVNLDGIENLTNLEYLFCHTNQLTDLDVIENLTNLQYLSCSDNQLINLDGIENLRNLKTLYCGNNNFSEDYKKYLRNYCKQKNIKLYL